MPHTLIGWFSYGLFDLVGLFIVWRGRRWERISGFVLLAYNAATSLVQDRVNWMDPEARLLTLASALLVYFLVLALVFGRRWMIFAAAFQLLSTLSYPAAHFAREIGPFAYLSIGQSFAYGVYLSVAFGAALTPRTGSAPREAARVGELNKGGARP